MTTLYALLLQEPYIGGVGDISEQSVMVKMNISYIKKKLREISRSMLHIAKQSAKNDNHQQPKVIPSCTLSYTGSCMQNLVDDLKSELSGNFEKVMVGLMMTTVGYDAHELKSAIKVRTTQLRLLIGHSDVLLK